MGAIKLAKAEMCSSQSWQKSQSVNNDQQSAENRVQMMTQGKYRDLSRSAQIS